MKPNRKIIVISSLILSYMVLAACQANLFTYRGATAKPEIRIALKDGGPHTGSWNTHDLSVQYEYTTVGNTLKLSGDIALRYNWPVVETFDMRISFLDRDNRILDSRNFYYYGYRRPLTEMNFVNTFTVPEGTEAFGFSYDGELRGHGDDGGWSFWLDPRRSDKYGFFY